MMVMKDHMEETEQAQEQDPKVVEEKEELEQWTVPMQQQLLLLLMMATPAAPNRKTSVQYVLTLLSTPSHHAGCQTTSCAGRV
jgi:hypothetical protein